MLSVSKVRTNHPVVVAATKVDSVADQDALEQTDGPWVTIVWNDPVNLMTYVAYVFESYFGFSQAKAHALMMQVHTDGKTIVSRGGREVVERDVQAMHEFGLWATMSKQGE